MASALHKWVLDLVYLEVLSSWQFPSCSTAISQLQQILIQLFLCDRRGTNVGNPELKCPLPIDSNLDGDCDDVTLVVGLHNGASGIFAGILVPGEN